jgi:hypothetical protein
MIYDEVISFLAQLSPANLIAFRPSPDASARYEALVQQEKTIGLNTEEKSELDKCEMIEHLMRKAKLQARKLVANE